MSLHPFVLGILALGLVTSAAGAAGTPANPLLKPWSGPYGGVPPFDQVKVADFAPALRAAMAENLAEVDAIANRTDAPTFANTIEALERSGETLKRVNTVYHVWSGNVNGPEFHAVEAEMEPLLAAHADKITQNAKLFARIAAVYEASKTASWTPEQKRLAWVWWKNFTHQGAQLSPADKATLAGINKDLAALYTQFRANQLADEEQQAIVLENAADVAGLPPSLVDAAAADAERHGMKGKWRIANTRSAMEPFLERCPNRELRRKAFELWASRGDQPGEHDNNVVIPKILALRAQKAKLLGFPTFAHWKIADNMAATPDAALGLTMKVWAPAVEQVHRDVAEMQAIVDAEQGGFKIEPWDYRYYAEKLRKAKYDLDMNEVKPYLQLEKVREAMFWVAGKLYGFTFVPVTNIPVFHPDVRVYEVLNATGGHVGYWYFDPYARIGKRSGAWMTAYREQQLLGGDVTTIVSNNTNFTKPAPGQPVLISWEDASTMFHEFGHALHGLNSHVTYPTLSGTSVARDFVEFPSQVHEHWLSAPEVIQRFLVNTAGKPMPAELLAKIQRAGTFNIGFSTVETLASTIVDLRIHLLGDTAVDPRAYEKQILAEIGMPHEIVMRHRLPQFGHVFSGDGYSAGYYAYLWAEVLDHDAWEAFTEAGGPFDAATAKRFREQIMSVGNTVDPGQAFRNFRGRDPDVNALLRHHGFAPAK